jgi:Activator of Hsp90 ATPase homolog 1-like protein
MTRSYAVDRVHRSSCVTDGEHGYAGGTTTKEDTLADHVATAAIEINASRGRIWSALTDPEQIEKYMFGSRVETDWERGSPIAWKGEYQTMLTGLKEVVEGG